MAFFSSISLDAIFTTYHYFTFYNLKIILLNPNVKFDCYQTLPPPLPLPLYNIDLHEVGLRYP